MSKNEALISRFEIWRDEIEINSIIGNLSTKSLLILIFKETKIESFLMRHSAEHFWKKEIPLKTPCIYSQDENLNIVLLEKLDELYFSNIDSSHYDEVFVIKEPEFILNRNFLTEEINKDSFILNEIFNNSRNVRFYNYKFIEARSKGEIPSVTTISTLYKNLTILEIELEVL